MARPITAADLYRRLSRAIDNGRGMKLSAEELDLLVLSGAYERLSAHASEQLRALAEERIAARSRVRDEAE